MFSAEIADDVRLEEFRPNFNVAPSTRVFAVARSETRGRLLGRFQWGLVPAWSREPSGTGHVNARAETAAEKPSFRDSFRKRRCVIPMSGYYEWRTVPEIGRKADAVSEESKSTGTKAPFGKRAVYVTRSDGRPMAVAGLWSIWSGGEGATDVRRTCCVITTQANGRLAAVHDRKPLLLDEDSWDLWLDGPVTPGGDISTLTGILLGRGTDDDLAIVDVGPLVNSVRNNGPELIEPVIDRR